MKLGPQDAYIIEQFGGGATMQQIGDELGISRQRVQQRLARHGVSRRDGGAHFRGDLRRDEIDQVRERRCIQRWGHSRAAHRRIGPIARTAFWSQRNHVRNWLGITWTLTLAEWWAIWQRSGKWAKRGQRRDGYVLGRLDKSGPFSRDNVAVMSLAQNSSVTQRQLKRSA